jgi:hypothetical protein
MKKVQKKKFKNSLNENPTKILYKFVYLGLRVKCRRVVNSLTGPSLPLIG